MTITLSVAGVATLAFMAGMIVGFVLAAIWAIKTG
jgi:hypothetical protein